MGLNPELLYPEVLIQLTIRKKPGISIYKAIKEYLNFGISSRDVSIIKSVRTPEFLGQNFGFMQLTPPEPEKPVAKKTKPLKAKRKK